MNAGTKTVTNQEILRNVQEIAQNQQDMAQSLQDFMQMTSEGLDKLDRNMEATNERLDGVEGEMRLLKGEVKDLTQASYRHELQLADFARTQDRLNDLFTSTSKKFRSAWRSSKTGCLPLPRLRCANSSWKCRLW